jgi:hypothetical protein
MLFSLLYFLVRRLLGACGRHQDERDIELLVLRHQVKVLQRQVTRPRLTRLDRVLLAAASRAMPRSSWSSFLVRPETLLRWHRELVRKKWTYRRTGQPGRPPVEPDLRALIVRLGRENPRSGYQRIRGELRKLGIRISATTVRTILLRGGLDPAPRRGGPTWTSVPPVTGGGDPRDRLLHRRDDRSQDALRPVLHRALDPARAPRRRHRPPRLGVGHRSRRGTSPSRSGCRVCGSSCATGTPSSRDRSMRCSAPRASGSSERRSAHLGRMLSPSGSCGPCAVSASTTS